jgi:tetraacyldisaccharide-1-P 4'-kinase
LGIKIVLRRAFEDHHQYTPAELKTLARQEADVLVTTEKDAMNLPKGAGAIVAPLKLWWLRIGIEIDKEDELLRRIL